MLRFVVALSVLVGIQACSSSVEKEFKVKKETKMKSDKIINVAMFYLKEGKNIEKLRSKGNVILEKYGAKIERVIKPTMLAQGDLSLPDEIHFAVYPNQEAMDAFNADPEFLALKKDVVAPAVEKMVGFVTQETEFEFDREIGDNSKTYGVAMVYIKNGKKYADQFETYHKEACKIIPEFGTHFERFLEPIESKGGLKQPNEIHCFYFDSQEGMQKMVNDTRMQALFPQRDTALDNLIFIIGEAIQ